LEKVQKEIRSYGGKCDVFTPLDIRKEEDCQAVIKAVLQRHGRLDGLVNNAGLVF
jgi:NAD(P)-dependent dehydrogenase (short-subunit alcohol dehydrogenase family)